ncbi:AbrB/MazE/SpoVT family DNA-binding domain-containing protein [Vulcanococcus sp.]|jgi:antitoxin PrlF|uniref:AbrB/MazE/SpoVT family DNA-binding domain-containing protein n=1 Tax=Vulcanococcus sp. TaxID=2856995 RepID=UPI003C02BB83
MTSVTLSSKGQLTIPRQLRESLGLTPGTRLMVSVDQDGRLILVPSLYEPEELFRHRPAVQRTMTLEEMDRAIAAAAGREDA